MNEHTRHIALLKSALPYVTPESRHAMEFILQADTLMTMAKELPNQKQNNDLEATENAEQKGETQKPDLEGMLLHIKPYCTPKESDFVQMTINFIRARHLFHNYQDYINSHPSEQNSTNDNEPIFNFFLSQLSTEQQSLLKKMKQEGLLNG